MTHSFRQLVCNLLIFVLLFNTLTPAAVFASQTMLGEQNKVLVCTSNGFKWVTSDAQIEINMDVQLDEQHCSMCLVNDDDHITTNQHKNILMIVSVAQKRPRQSERVTNTLYLHEQGSRAPPIKS